MRKLLRANFSRLWKDKVFLLSIVVMLLVGIGSPLMHYFNHDLEWTLDFSFFTHVLLAAVLAAVISAMYIGSEYESGTMRNKRIAGHTRSLIYLANLIVCTVAGLILCIVHMIPLALLSYLLGSRFTAAPLTVLLYMGLDFAVIIAFSALFTMIAMLWQSKPHAAAACILLSGALLLWGVQITSALNEPEYFPGYTYVDEATGTTTEESAMKNPNYLTGTKRQVYEFLQDFTPGGQALQIASMDTDAPGRLAVYDAAILLLSTSCGIIFFRRKDLK